MVIAILSDVHDNVWKLADVLDQLDDAEALLFCGDFCAPFTLKQMAQDFDGPVHAVFGNNDGDQFLLERIAAQSENATLHGHLIDLTLDGVRIAVNHYPDIARGLAASRKYDLVCYGHDHTYNVETVGDTTLLNPGEVMGRDGASTFILYDTETGTVTRGEA